MIRFASRAVGLCLFAACAVAIAAPQLVVPVTPAGPLATRSGVKPGAPVRFNAEGLARVQPGMEVELTLPDGSRHAYVYERSVPHGGGFNTWIARSATEGDSARAIVTHGPAGSFGWMATGYGEYFLRPSGDGHDLLARRSAVRIGPAAGGSDAVVAPPDDPQVAPWKGISTSVDAHAAGKSFGLPKATPGDARQADVMVLYTRDLANKLGTGLLPMIYNLIASANQAYADSEIALSLRLVNATLIDYPNANPSDDTLDGMRNFGPHAASFSGLTHPVGASLRDTVGADYVAVVRDGPTDTGGIGFLLKNPSLYPTVQVVSSIAYSVNNFCAEGCEAIFAHELGHNMGNTHDRATVARDSGGTVNPAEAVFPYSFGHNSCINGYTCNPFVAGGCPSGYAQCLNRAANDFGTIMSYVPPRVMKFSNPEVLCVPPGGSNPGRACGSLPGTPAPEGESNNAKSMNNIRQNISAYRNQTLASLPGSLQFTNAAFTGTEAGGTLAFTVSRASGSSGAVSVNYTVSAGTATAGIDFTAANGTLQWADGDASNKTINVTLANDMAVEGIEAFSIALSAPAGATGVYLGYPTVATGLILETWPVGTLGGLPAGFTTPPASPAAWAIADDASNDADGRSLKSGGLNFNVLDCPNDPDFAGSFPFVPCPSIVQASGTFTGGSVAFAYKVSAYPGWGFLEFLVDGTVVQQATGSSANTAADTGWQFFSTPISAGAHTLQWRFRTSLPFACAGASPGGPPPHPQCQDRAWIDQVSLPLGVAASTTSLLSSLNPAASGQSVTFTASVSGSSGTPTGTVAFRDGASAIPGCAAVVLAAGSAACATSALLPGVHAITAVYSGSPTYGPSTSSAVNETISSGPQLLSANPASLDFGGHSMGTTAPARTVTITNVSGGSVTVGSIVPPTGYSVVTHNCATLAAAATCSATLAFTPTTEGTVAGAVAVTYAGGGPTVVNVTGIGERSLITHYYRSILRRAPDAGGKAFWEAEAARMSGLGANVNETWYSMASFFYFSPEYLALGRDDAGFVTDLYNTFFNRPPDGAGLAFWTGQLATGTPREVVLVSFMLSGEFVTFAQGIFGNTAARAEVDVVMDFFRGLLSRLPDTAGFNHWVGQFRVAQCAGAGAAGAVYTQVESISSAFASSGEYIGRARTNAQYVGDLYNAFLRRGGDQGGVLFWIGQLDSGAMTRDFVRQQFIASPEFTNRVNAVIALGCVS